METERNNRLHRPTATLLTDRERQVIDGLANGLLYKEIADRLGISFSAVHKHQHNIFAKLRVSNRTEAVSKWRHLVSSDIALPTSTFTANLG